VGRAAVTPAARGRRASQKPNPHPLAKHVRMSWMQRLKRVFAIDIQKCRRCGGTLRVIASIENPLLIERILSHRQPPSANHSPFSARAPPTTASFF
jgi:hypothetical protein